MIMPGPQRMSGEAFAIERLREDPDLDYAALRRQAADAGVSMMPIQYGRARKQLGLPPLKGGGAAAAAAERDSDDARRRGAARNDEDEPDRRDGDAAPEDERAAATAQPADADGDDDETPGDTDAGDVARDDSSNAGADLVAPRRKGSAAFDFLVQELRREPNAAYATLRDRSAAKGWKVAPIMYGRAKAVLGLVPVKPRGAAKKNAPPAPPRTLRQVESVAADRFSKQLEEVRNVDQLVAVVRELDAERRRLRDLLDRIVGMIDDALGGQ
jgi:hypothetical protein